MEHTLPFLTEKASLVVVRFHASPQNSKCNQYGATTLVQTSSSPLDLRTWKLYEALSPAPPEAQTPWAAKCPEGLEALNLWSLALGEDRPEKKLDPGCCEVGGSFDETGKVRPREALGAT